MKKFLPYILILVIFVGIIAPISSAHGQVVTGNVLTDTAIAGVKYAWNSLPGIPGVTDFYGFLVDLIYNAILAPFAALLGIAGSGLDLVIKWTIMDMSDNLAKFKGINIAWKLLRDLMNVAFIFILVYEAILLILGQSSTQNIGKFLGFLVLAALLVNFSLFFTKVLIDASNIVTIGIYNNIIDGANVVQVKGFNVGGLSYPFMSKMGIGRLYGDEGAIKLFGSGVQAAIAMIAGAAFMLIASIIFLVITVMFIVRYITLLLLLMLAPVGYMGSALSFMKKPSADWWRALNSQLIFPPVYMILTWVVLTLMGSDGFIRGVTDPNAGFFDVNNKFQFLFNYIVIICLMIATLVISKDISTKGSTAIAKATKSGSAWAFSGTSWVGRKTAGSVGNRIANNANLNAAAKSTSNSFLARTAARATLYGAKAAGSGTYDMRNASVPTGVIGDLISGTAGRTKAGKALGLDNVNIANISGGVSHVLDEVGAGKGGTLDYAGEVAAKKKAQREQAEKEKNRQEMIAAIKSIKDGANAKPGDANYDKLIADMEKAIAERSAKEIETLVASNRELLASQEFATKISIKQLETLEKSEQFTDTEKAGLKKARFKEIETLYDASAMSDYNTASAVPESARTQDQKDAIERVEKARKRVKGLSESELKMMDPMHLEKDEFIGELKASQFEKIATSDDFTATQKKDVRERRLSPLFNALDTSRVAADGVTSTYSADPALVKKMFASNKGLSPKDIAALMGTKATYVDAAGTSHTESILIHPDVLELYSPGRLRQMASAGDMSPDDIQTIRTAIKDAFAADPTNAKLQILNKFLDSDDGINNFS